MHEFEMEGEYSDNPAIDTGGRGYIRVRKHAFDVRGIDFDNQVAYSNEVQFESTKGAI